jgi:hypothetical protein
MFSIIPIPVIAPMEHPVVGLTRPRGVRKNPALLNGGTSLKLSEGDLSPVLEAHPGSPVDISSRPRPSLAASLNQRLYHGTDAELAKFNERKARIQGRREDSIRRDGGAAKGSIFGGGRDAKKKDGEALVPNHRRMQVAGANPFFIPAKITEQEEVLHPISPLALDDVDILMTDVTPIGTPRTPGTPDEEAASTPTAEPASRLSLDTEMSMHYDFKTENGIWISANPLAMESRSSLNTNTTYMSNSTITDDRFDRMSTVSHALTLDTSVASSAASMMSSIGSIQSASSADVYGWEEELDRKETNETMSAWEREVSRRLPSGGRTLGPRRDMSGGYGGKRKSLLYRVLNLSGGRRASTDGTNTPPMPPLPVVLPTPGMPSQGGGKYPTPTTSA